MLGVDPENLLPAAIGADTRRNDPGARGVHNGMTRLLVSFAALCGLACAVPAQAPSPDSIVARYIAARGGLDRLRAIRTIIYRGEYHEGTEPLHHAAMGLMRPYYKLVGDPEHPSRDFAEGYDGSAWEFYGDPGVVIRTVGAASAAGRHATAIDGPLVDYASRGWTITSEGIDRVDGHGAYRLRVHMLDGFEQEELVDTTTWLLIAERRVAPIHAFGASVTSEERIGDYRSVDGVLFPFSHREVEIATGRVLNEMHWTSITVNHSLDPAVFSPPPFTPTPLQAFLAQLYAERADTSAVLWSYHDFRAAHRAIDTHAGIEFIGYQMLKMGDVRSAVRLLLLDAADYPTVASAAFGLGRAYQTAGDSTRAGEWLRRAHAMDPRYPAS
jgi:hypothetical protein